MTPASLSIPSRGWPPEEICRLNAENTRQPVHNVNAGSIDASLEGTDVGPVDLGAVRQFFLRKALGLTQLPQIDGQYLSYLHGRESTVLKSISPRSILDKGAATTGSIAAPKPCPVTIQTVWIGWPPSSKRMKRAAGVWITAKR